MSKILRIYSGLSTKEFEITKIENGYKLDMVAYGDWIDCGIFKTTKIILKKGYKNDR